MIETFSEDGKPRARENYKNGLLQGHVERFWVEQGHAIKEADEYDQDRMLKQNLYVDDALTEELEYFPDGSLKNHIDHVTAASKTRTTKI